MNSFDMFDTLVARRCVEDFVTNHADPQMEQEAQEMIPIRENVLKVQPGDVIVSDMYLPQAFLKEQLERTTGLRNELFVGPIIKSSGEIWETLKKRGTSPQTHLDNAGHCLESARRAGITPVEARQADLTEVERELRPVFPSLAKLIREVRLTTYNAQFRDLELAQAQANFPFLFLASIILHRRMVNLRRVLVSARDGFLWHKLLTRVRDLIGGKYEVVYFLTSRLAMQRGSDRYVQYVNTLLQEPSVVVDLMGTGRAFSEFRGRLKKSDVPFLLMVRYTVCPKVSRCEQVMENESNSHYIEFANLARTRMVLDVDETGTPVYQERRAIDWENWEPIRVMHETFEVGLASMENYDFRQDLSVPDDVLLVFAKKLCKRMEKTHALGFFQSAMGEDERMRLL